MEFWETLKRYTCVFQKAREIESTIEDCPTEVKSTTTVTTLE